MEDDVLPEGGKNLMNVEAKVTKLILVVRKYVELPSS